MLNVERWGGFDQLLLLKFSASLHLLLPAESFSVSWKIPCMNQNDGSSMLLSLLYFAAATVTHIKFPFCSYWVSGANAGKKEVFVDNLPGYPDNIRLSHTGLYRVGISTTRFPSFFSPFLDALGPYPFLKRFIAKVTLTLCSINYQYHKNVNFFKY